MQNEYLTLDEIKEYLGLVVGGRIDEKLAREIGARANSDPLYNLAIRRGLENLRSHARALKRYTDRFGKFPFGESDDSIKSE
jgi:hypothetical protein